MEERRVEALVIVAGGVGLVVGRILFARSEVWTIDLDVWFGPFYLWFGLSLILLGLATWHFLRFGVGTLVAIAVLAVGAFLLTLNDFFDGDLFWSRRYSTVRSVGAWLIVASMALVLIGVLWSAGQHLTDMPATATWWRRRWVIGVGGVAVFSIIGSVSFIFFGDEDSPVPATDAASQGDGGPVQDGWSISISRDDEGSPFTVFT